MTELVLTHKDQLDAQIIELETAIIVHERVYSQKPHKLIKELKSLRHADMEARRG